MKRIILLCFCLVAFTGMFAQHKQSGRKKVGVVLSGGGAKGAAHVKALKVIEEAGIPIDYIAGTSIGSLVGGMYASGYNADQIDSLMRSQNWTTLLTDKSKRKHLSLYEREQVDRNILSAKFDKKPGEIIEGGVLKGYNVAKLLTEITADTPDSMSFNDLKIPFACVATDVVTGEEVDLHSGVLAECMRASMAIPTVFTPVVKGDRVLTDGGTTNNYPVDLVRKMGADYVIGVDLSPVALPSNKINTTQSIAMRLLDLLCKNKHDENVANTDVHIKVNVKGYSSSSFNSTAIDSLMHRGEIAAREKWDELIALREKLGLKQPLPAPEPRPMPENMYDVVPVPSIYKANERNSFAGVGARFDNEELASLLLDGMLELNHKKKLSVGFEGRLGRRLNIELYSKLHLSNALIAQLKYNFKYNDMKIYDKGARVSEETNNGHIVQLDFSHYWRNWKVMFGSRYSYYSFDESLVHKDYLDWTEDTSSEPGLSYFGRVTFDNRDANDNATQGMFFTAGYELFTDNGATFEGGKPVNIFDAKFTIALPLSHTTTLTPSVAGRWTSNNDYFTLCNCIGGVNTDGHYFSQQIAFAGINYLQLVRRNLFVAGMTLRQAIASKHYVFAVGNFGLHSDKFFKAKSPDHLYGAALGYGYKSAIGPLELNFNWSNMTKKLGISINVGYMF